MKYFGYLCLAGLLVSCASTAPALKVEEAPPEVSVVVQTPPPAAPIKQISLTPYIGKPLGDLEALTGTPALTRVEGVGKFLRYDFAECRIYAVTAIRGGTEIVETIEVGPLKQGMPKPDISACLAVGV